MLVLAAIVVGVSGTTHAALELSVDDVGTVEGAVLVLLLLLVSSAMRAASRCNFSVSALVSSIFFCKSAALAFASASAFAFSAFAFACSRAAFACSNCR